MNANIVVDLVVSAGVSAGDMCAPATGDLSGGYHVNGALAQFTSTLRGTEVSGTIGCTGSSAICNMIPPFMNTKEDLAVNMQIANFGANPPMGAPAAPSGARLRCNGNGSCFLMNQRALVIQVMGTLDAYVQLMGTHNGAAPVCVTAGQVLTLCPVTPPTP